MAKKRERVLGEQAYIDALLGTNTEVLEKATRKEASRMVGELLKWREYHQEYDPTGEAELIWCEKEDDGGPGLFELVDKAERYRYTLYNRNKSVRKINADMFEIFKKTKRVDSEEYVELQGQLTELELEQIGLCWLIRKIYMHIKVKAGGLDMGTTAESLDEDRDYYT